MSSTPSHVGQDSDKAPLVPSLKWNFDPPPIDVQNETRNVFGYLYNSLRLPTEQEKAAIMAKQSDISKAVEIYTKEMDDLVGIWEQLKEKRAKLQLLKAQYGQATSPICLLNDDTLFNIFAHYYDPSKPSWMVLVCKRWHALLTSHAPDVWASMSVTVGGTMNQNISPECRARELQRSAQVPLKIHLSLHMHNPSVQGLLGLCGVFHDVQHRLRQLTLDTHRDPRRELDYIQEMDNIKLGSLEELVLLSHGSGSKNLLHSTLWQRCPKLKMLTISGLRQSATEGSAHLPAYFDRIECLKLVDCSLGSRDIPSLLASYKPDEVRCDIQIINPIIPPPPESVGEDYGMLQDKCPVTSLAICLTPEKPASMTEEPAATYFGLAPRRHMDRDDKSIWLGHLLNSFNPSTIKTLSIAGVPFFESKFFGVQLEKFVSEASSLQDFELGPIPANQLRTPGYLGIQKHCPSMDIIPILRQCPNLTSLRLRDTLLNGYVSVVSPDLIQGLTLPAADSLSTNAPSQNFLLPRLQHLEFTVRGAPFLDLSSELLQMVDSRAQRSTRRVTPLEFVQLNRSRTPCFSYDPTDVDPRDIEINRVFKEVRADVVSKGVSCVTSLSPVEYLGVGSDGLDNNFFKN